MTKEPGTVWVDYVHLSDLDEVQLRAYQDLAREAAEPNPFFSPELLLPAARWLPGGDSVCLLRVWRDGRLVLAMPVRRGPYRRVPVPGLSTWRHPYCYLGTPLVYPDSLDIASAAALQSLRRSGADWFVLEQVYIEGPVVRAFQRAAGSSAVSWTEHGVWERPAVLGQQRRIRAEGLSESSSSARSMRRKLRNLERKVGTVEIREVTRAANPLELDAEIDAFLEMELAGWKGRAGTAMASSSSHASFFRETCRAFAGLGGLDMWQLQAGTIRAAQECHLRIGDTVFAWRTSYNEELSPFSPGALIELDLLRAFCADSESRSLDPCTGNEVRALDRYYPDRRQIGDVLVGFTPLGRALIHVYSRMAQARAWARARSVKKR